MKQSISSAGASEPIISIIRHDGAWRAKYFLEGSFEGVILKPVFEDESPCGSPLLRVHSSCLFSEALGACDCDCSAQLDTSMKLIREHGGVCVYLYDEGRGAGLHNKFKAIHIQQDSGCGTAEAFHELGLAPDPRSYPRSLAAEVAAFAPEYGSFRLLSNNPRKLHLLRRRGFVLDDIAPLVCNSEDALVHAYLEDKREGLHHIL